ncbi:MAG TPA: Uma2 family endonuclease [Bryobacteraceae bacterium]|nr:Uma2 family endonuclease [Bryobacteraceae bacterium]
MAVEAQELVPVEKYLRTSYSPDREYRDGVVLERNAGDEAHSSLQALLTIYIGGRQKQWNVKVYTEFRIKIRDGWYPLPDVCVYAQPAPKERYPDRPPLLWIEILSEDDRIADVWAKAAELVKHGVAYVWLIDPHTLESQLWTAAGAASVADRTLRIPETPIVIPLMEVMEQ